MLFLGVLWGPGNQCGIPWFFMILWISESFSLYLLVKNSFNFKLGFFTDFEYISRGIIRKNILHQDYHRAKDIVTKKSGKTFQKLAIKNFFSMLNCESSLLWAFMVQNFCKNSFSGAKSRKNGIPVMKITFILQKIPQNYRVPWVNTITIKYTCRFNTS